MRKIGMIASAALAAASAFISTPSGPPRRDRHGKTRSNYYGRRIDHENFDHGRYKVSGQPREAWTYRGARKNANRRYPANGKLHARLKQIRRERAGLFHGS